MNKDELIKTYINALTTSQQLSHSFDKTKPLLTNKLHPLCYKRALEVDQNEYVNYVKEKNVKNST